MQGTGFLNPYCRCKFIITIKKEVKTCSYQRLSGL